MVKRLVLVLGDQLSHDLSALAEADKGTDTIVMAEVAEETEYVPHHPKKMNRTAGMSPIPSWMTAKTQAPSSANCCAARTRWVLSKCWRQSRANGG